MKITSTAADKENQPKQSSTMYTRKRTFKAQEKKEAVTQK